MQERRDPARIALELQQTFSLADAAATQYLKQARKLLETIGVLRGFEPLPVAAPDKKPVAAQVVSCGHQCFVGERHYRLLGSRIRMRFTHADLLALVDPVLHHLRNHDEVGPATVDIDVVRLPGGPIHLCRDERSLLSCAAANQLAPLAKTLVWQAAIQAHDYFLNIHAGVVGDGDRSYLFPAAPGSGKSTLVAALIRHGFEYFSDEVALLHEATLQVEAVPLALCVKASGVAALAPYYPQLAGLGVHQRNDGKQVRYLPPPPQTVPPAGSRRDVAAIVFPHYSPGQVSALERLGSAQALQLLLRECLIVDTRLTVGRVAALLAWIERTPCYRLVVSELDAAVTQIQSLARERSDCGNAERVLRNDRVPRGRASHNEEGRP